MLKSFACGHFDRPHHGFGLCKSCYNVMKKREWLQVPENRARENEKKRKYYAKKKDKILSI